MDNLLQAIAREEGFGPVHNRATRNCNPGNINYGTFAIAHGATHCEPSLPNQPGRFAVFPTADIGFAAMKALLQEPAYAGLTVGEALNKWAPPADDNDTSSYEANVCSWVGCTPDTPIEGLLG